MRINESRTDRIIRVVIGVLLAVLYFTGTLTGTIGIIGLIVAAVLIITGVVGFCPMYALLKMKTK